MADEQAGDSAGKRALWLIVASLLLGAAALWGSSELTWFAEYRDVGVRGTVLHTETGGQRSTVLVPLAVLALAGIAGVVATGGWARRVLGAVLVAAGAALVGIGITGTDLAGDGAYPAMTILAGHGLAVLGGLLFVAAGVLTIRMARRMSKLGARYSSPGEKRAARDPDTELWDSLSAGEDPT